VRKLQPFKVGGGDRFLQKINWPNNS
jgi:hypothetical protein